MIPRAHARLIGSVGIGFAWCSLVAAGWGAEPGTFRDLIRRYAQQQEKPDPAVEVAALPGLPEDAKIVALEYTVLIRKAPGEEEAVDSTKHSFRVGDQIRVRIKPLNGLYIYIFHEGASGHRTCLLPTEKEVPPLASANKDLDLPSDGSVFEFTPPAGDEKLIVVAIEQPNVDLAALSDVVFKKPDEELTPREKEIQNQLKAKGQQTLKSILERQAQSTRYRGLFSDESIATVKTEMSTRGTTRAMLEEPPHGNEKSTLSMAVTRKGDKNGELYVTIPLKSTTGP